MIGIGLYGDNGHQLFSLLSGHNRARVVAVAGISGTPPFDQIRIPPETAVYQNLEAMLRDPQVEVVSLCSPCRRTQAQEAIACLQAGRHVYAEKPCAMNGAALDAILEAAKTNDCRFHEMAGTAFSQPYLAMRDIVQSGQLGTVIQVAAQKSYPLHTPAGRPQDESIDGGLLMQAGIHAVRMVEHVAGTRIRHVRAWETGAGNPVHGGGLRIASSMQMELFNGGLATVITNYLHDPGSGQWGNDALSIFGTSGVLESWHNGTETRLVAGGRDFGAIETSQSGRDYFEYMLDELIDKAAMPLTLEDELHPTRVVIQAKDFIGQKGMT